VVAEAEDAPPAKMKAAVAGDRVESSFCTFERGDAGGVGVVWPPAVGEAGAEATELLPAAARGGDAGRGGNAWRSRMARAGLVSLLPAATGWRHTEYK